MAGYQLGFSLDWRIPFQALERLAGPGDLRPLISVNGRRTWWAWLTKAMEVAMKETRTKNALLAAGVFVCGTMASIELPKDHGLSHRTMNRAVVISIPTAAARQADEPICRSSCAVIRYCVARYSAPAAEAWARSRGATEAEIQIARRCVKPEQTVLLGQAAA